MLKELIKEKIINEWDPYDLISGGTPDDEFEKDVSNSRDVCLLTNTQNAPYIR